MFAKCVLNLQSEEESIPAEVNAENPSSEVLFVMSSATFFRSAKDLMSSGVYPASFNNVLFVIIPYVSITYPIPATESPSFSA